MVIPFLFAIPSEVSQFILSHKNKHSHSSYLIKETRSKWNNGFNDVISTQLEMDYKMEINFKEHTNFIYYNVR